MKNFQPKWQHSIFAKEPGRPKTLDLSGSRSQAFRHRKLSLVSKARIAASVSRYYKTSPFVHKRKKRSKYLKRRV